MISLTGIPTLDKIWSLISARTSGPMPWRPSALSYWDALQTLRSVSAYNKKHLGCIGDGRGGDGGAGAGAADGMGGGALAAGELLVDCKRPELVSIWKRRMDVMELTSTLGISVRAGGGCAFHVGYKKCALFATSNEGILGGVVNVAWPSSCKDVEIFIVKKVFQTIPGHGTNPESWPVWVQLSPLD